MQRANLDQSIEKNVKLQRDKILFDLIKYRDKLGLLIEELKKAQTMDEILNLIKDMIKV